MQTMKGREMSGETVTIPANDWGESLRERKALLYRIEQLEGALREIALDSTNPTNQRSYAAERAEQALQDKD